MKKLILYLLIATMLVSILSACNNDPNPSPVEPDPETQPTIGTQPSPDQDTEQNTSQDSTQNNTQDSTQSSTQDTTQPPPEQDLVKLAEVYEKYPNLIEIKEFHNGLAVFTVRTEDRIYPELYGFMDVQGNVIIDPVYYQKGEMMIPDQYIQYPSFEEHSCVTLTQKKKVPVSNSSYTYETVKKLIDKQGHTHFITGENSVTDIGLVHNGYFWVQTYEEQFTGDVYTVTYYSTQNMNPVATFQEYYPENSAVSDDGSFTLYKGNKAYDFNMADYDPNFNVSEPEDTWQIDVENLDDFKNVDVYYHVSSAQNSIGQIATVIIENASNKHYFATVDSTGNILMQPQKSISFGVDENNPNTWSTLYYLVNEFSYCYDLCPAMDVESGKWGYIDSYGNWVIQPQYGSAKSFTQDGYAIVNSMTVINTNGEIVLSGQEFTLEDIFGTYSSDKQRLTLSPDGTFTVKEYPIEYTGKFSFDGGYLIVDGLGIIAFWPFNPDQANQDGSYPIAMKDGFLIINGKTWTKISAE